MWPLACGALFAALSLHPLSDNDLFWHLALGRSVLESHSRIVPEPLAIEGFGATCIVHEWLWDVMLFSVRRAYGWVALSWFVVIVAALAGAAFGALLTRWPSKAPNLFVAAALSLLTAPIIVTRISERPESASMIFWPVGLLLAKSLAESKSTRAAALRAAGLVALALLWAQIHLSILGFTLAAAIILAPRVWGREVSDRLCIVAIVGVGLAVLTSAPGMLVFTIPSRITSYIATHVAEWMPLRWNMLDPSDPDDVQGPAYAALVLVAALLGLRLGRRASVEIALAALGILLVFQGRRMVTAATLLTLPLALTALDARIGHAGTFGARASRWVAAAIGLAVSVRMVSWTQAHVGTVGKMGLAEGEFPMAAARLLRASPGEHRAFTTYRSGPPVSFETDSRVRTFVDSRTPLFIFDDADLGAATAAWSKPQSLPVATARYGFDLAVVDRAFPVCAALAASTDWALIHVEPSFATFARTTSPLAANPIRRVLPCGEPFLDEKSCAPPLSELDTDLTRIGTYASQAFVSYLRADRQIRCAKGTFDGDAVLSLLPSPEDASGFEAARDDVHAWLLALAGRRREAMKRLAPHVNAGRTWVLRDSIATIVKGGGADAEARDVLQKLVDDAGEGADDANIVALATACFHLGDVRCARLQASRAAALGRFDVGPVLCWLRQSAPTPETRQDADKWLEALRRGAPPAVARDLTCAPEP